MADAATDAVGEPRELVVIVHGTFARASRWIRPGSRFLECLGRRVRRHEIRSFDSTGRNSHDARIEAGKALAAWTKEVCETERFRKVWCVAHSHGGNVLLYAMRDGEFGARLAGPAFLGTPFLRITLRDIRSFSRSFTKVLSWLILFPVLLPGVVMLLTTLAMNYLGPWGLGFMLVIGNVLIVGLYLQYRRRLQEWGEESLGRMLEATQARLHDWIAQPEPPCPECTDAPREVCKIALAQVNSDRVEVAYRRTDLFDKRRSLMDDWAAYVASGGG